MSDITAGDWKTANHFLQCRLFRFGFRQCSKESSHFADQRVLRNCNFCETKPRETKQSGASFAALGFLL
jgi:hypothetical protein